MTEQVDAELSSLNIDWQDSDLIAGTLRILRRAWLNSRPADEKARIRYTLLNNLVFKKAQAGDPIARQAYSAVYPYKRKRNAPSRWAKHDRKYKKRGRVAELEARARAEQEAKVLAEREFVEKNDSLLRRNNTLRVDWPLVAMIAVTVQDYWRSARSDRSNNAKQLQYELFKMLVFDAGVNRNVFAMAAYNIVYPDTTERSGHKTRWQLARRNQRKVQLGSASGGTQPG
jgi:hypothetical protein